MTDPTNADRLLASFRELVRAEFPRLAYLGLTEWTVQSTDGTTCELSPTDTTGSLTSLPPTPIRLPLGSAKPAVGSRALVLFVNADPTRPVLFAIDPKPDEFSMNAANLMTIGADTLQIKIAGTGLPVARQTDAVVCGPFAGAITGPCSLKVTSGLWR